MNRDRGFVLVNALIIVAALAAAAVFLLARAEGGRLRLEARQGADQMEAYLDAFEALAMTRLQRDLGAGAVDHAGEEWAEPEIAVPLDRGVLSGHLRDEQGLFNLNWLVDPGNQTAQAAFDALLRRLTVSPATGEAIRAFLGPGGPERRAAYSALTPPIDPVGGALAMFDQLEDIPGIAPRDRVLLQRFATVLPGNSALNVNTAPAEVLAGFLPDLTAAELDRLLRYRLRAPFASVEEFARQAGLAPERLDSEAEAIPPFAVGSDWFGLEVRAGLDGRGAMRRAMLYRQPLPAGPEVRWRVSVHD